MAPLSQRVYSIVNRNMATLTAEEPDEYDIRQFCETITEEFLAVIGNRQAEAIVYDARFVLGQAYQVGMEKIDCARLREIADRVHDILRRPMYNSLPPDVVKLQEMIDAQRTAARSNAARFLELQSENDTLKARIASLEASAQRNGDGERTSLSGTA